MWCCCHDRLFERVGSVEGMDIPNALGLGM